MKNSTKKTIRIGVVVLFFLFITGYALLKAKDVIIGVKVKNIEINTYQENVMEITGNAKNAINLTLQGREISIDKIGNFSEHFALLPGYNIIEIKAEDKFGNSDQKNYQIMYKEDYAQEEN